MTADPLDEELQGKAYDGRLMRRFLACLKPHSGLVAATFLLMLLRVGFELATPKLVGDAIDGPISGGNLDELRKYVLFLACTILGTGAAEWAYALLMNLTGQRVILDLRTRLFAHLQRLPVSFFDRNPVGRLTVRVTNDVENLNELFTSGFVEFTADVLLLLGTVVMMFVVDWRLALVTMAITPVVAFLLLLFRRTARERYRDMRKKIARLNGYLNESVNGIRTIQVFGREAACLGKFRAINAEHRDSAVAALFAYSVFYPAVEALSTVAVAGLVAFGGLSILAGTLKFGVFITFWYYAYKFFMPVRELAEKYNILQAAMASSERVFGILDAPADPDPRADAAIPDLKGDVEFQNVSFSYDGKTPVLDDVSFKVPAGGSLAVVGLTGAGKTTIINLLLRFYAPTSGRILVDGRDVREYPLGPLRRRLGLVLQDVFLFAGTVEDNVRLGDPSIPRGRIEEAARAVNADRLLRRLPKGWETPVQERGTALSAGERQLLSLARALAFDPRILVLDEATSNVDGETERLIQDGLLRLMKGRTSIVVAHRLSTVRGADRVLVLHKGKLREQGTHAELLRLGGLYARLHALQFRDPSAPAKPPEEEAPPPVPEGGLA